MSLLTRAIRKVAFRMTPARRAALKKAVAASARARRKAASGAAPRLSRRMARRAARRTARTNAIRTTSSLGLARTASGRVARANFKGSSGRALRRATYRARLASSRARYKESSVGSKLRSAAIGLATPTNITRRRYSDLTIGENVRRNVSRYLKVSATVATAGAAVQVAAYNRAMNSYNQSGR